MILRQYQQRVIDSLYAWWVTHPGIEETPICVCPTGSGKSIIIAELTRLLFDTWPDMHPRTVVLVPSKELAEQNAQKLVALLPSHIRVGYYSASLGQKRPDADVIVATIGSIYKDALLLGNIRCVIVDECHLINPDGSEAGRYRKFLTSLARLCSFRVVGFTATPFRGNGVWLTDGESPLFTGIACTVTVQELLNANYLAPLVRPSDIKTRIDTSGIKTSNGDYNIAQLSERVEAYLPAAALEAVSLAQDRKKWIAFCTTVANAMHFVELLQSQGIDTALVCGDTPANEREQHIADFRAGRLRCLVTVLALAVGFDVPDVDCIIWCRPTQSPVLFVQGAGRGMRIADGKTDCLWLDFSDTTDRLGPVDAIKGRKKSAKKDDPQAPFCICPECGERVRPASALVCPSCGATIREPEAEAPVPVSNSAILSYQVAPKIVTYPVTNVQYSVHTKPGSPDSLRVDYYSGLRRVASEWVCFEHTGFARAKAEQWWIQRLSNPYPPNKHGMTNMHAPDVETALSLIKHYTKAECIGLTYHIKTPSAITVNETGKYPEIVRFEWSKPNDPDRTESNQTSLAHAVV